MWGAGIGALSLLLFSASDQALGSGEPAKKKNQISKARAAATTLSTTSRSTALIPCRLRASSSLSPRMLRSQGDDCRAAGGRPVSSSYAALSLVSARVSASSSTASTTTRTKTARMLVPAPSPTHPSKREPTQSASNGAPVQTLRLTSAVAATRPVRLVLNSRGRSRLGGRPAP